MRHRSRTVAIALAGLLAVATSLRAQPHPQVIERMAQWIDAVRAHEIGGPDVYATFVAAWSHEQIVEMFPYLEALLELVEAPLREGISLSREPQVVPGVPQARRRLYRLSAIEIPEVEVEQLRVLAALEWVQADPGRLLKRAAMLHADIAMSDKLRVAPFVPNSNVQPSVRRLGRSADERVIVRAPDADFRGIEYGVVHWDVARTLLDRVRPEPKADPFVRQWYRATLAYLVGEGFFGEAKPQFVRALELFPHDAPLLFSYGCMQAAMASPGVQEFVAATRLPRGLRMDIQSKGEHLGNAAELFERSLAEDATLTEARVRLGRVRLEQERPKEALTLLQSAQPEDSNQVLVYYRELFLGDAAAVLSQRDVAGAAYRRAALLYPTAQTPRLALSQLARSTNNGVAAFIALAPVFSLSDSRLAREDPWWDYHKGEGRHVSALLADLARAVPPNQ